MATELDPAIILAGGQINDPSRLLSLAKMSQELRQVQQKEAGQNALKQLFSSPGALDAQGNPTPQTIQRTMQVDPETGMALRQQTLDQQVKAAQAKHYETAAGQQKFDFLSSAAGIATDAYDAAKAAGKSDQEAVSAATAARNEALKNNGGTIDDQTASSAMASPFDPATAKTFAMANPDYAKRVGDTRKEDISEKRADEVARHDMANEDRMAGIAGKSAEKGWDLFTKPDGTVVRINKDSGEVKPLGDDAKGITKVGSGAGAESSLSKEDLDLYSDQIIAGDKAPLQNMGRGQQGSANLVALRKAVAEKARAKGLSGQDLAALDAEFGGTQAGEKELGSRTAKVGMAVDEANRFTELSRQAYAKLPRGEFVPFNKLAQLWETNTSSPEQAAAYAADNSLINAYARAVSPTGTPTVSDKDHAREMLSTAQGPEAHDAVINQLQLEMKAAIGAPKDVKAELRDGVTGKTDDKKSDSGDGWSVKKVQ